MKKNWKRILGGFIALSPFWVGFWLSAISIGVVETLKMVGVGIGIFAAVVVWVIGLYWVSGY